MHYIYESILVGLYSCIICALISPLLYKYSLELKNTFQIQTLILITTSVYLYFIKNLCNHLISVIRDSDK